MIVLWKLMKIKNVMFPFIVGCLTFVVSQVILRIPLLNLALKMPVFQELMMHTMAYFSLLALSAGLFEEVARWYWFYFMKRHQTIYDALSFGLGHGAIEAILLVAIPILQMGYVEFLDAFMGGVERISAMMAHIAFALIVFKGIQDQKTIYLFYAILMHALYDFFASAMISIGLPISFLESFLFIISVSMLCFCYKKARKKEGI